MRCELPPTFWSCTREAGHENPCAAVPSWRLTRWDKQALRIFLVSLTVMILGAWVLLSRERTIVYQQPVCVASHQEWVPERLVIYVYKSPAAYVGPQASTYIEPAHEEERCDEWKQ